VVFGERHLEFLARAYEDHDNTVRPHQGIGNRTIVEMLPANTSPDPSSIECEERCCGITTEPQPDGSERPTGLTIVEIIHFE